MMDKEDAVHSYNRILCSHKKEWNSDACYTMDEPWGHYAQGNKPNTKGLMLCDSTYMMYVESPDS